METHEEARITLIPPTPVSDQILQEVRIALRNSRAESETRTVCIFLDKENDEALMFKEETVLKPASSHCICHRFSTAGYAGDHTLIVRVQSARGGQTYHHYPLRIIPSPSRSVCRVDGAFVGFYHWSEKEGRLWNSDLKQMNAQDWRDQVRAQFELGMNIIVPQEMFSNQLYVGDHNIEQEGYGGQAFYPSKLFPGRMDIACPDPLEAILSEADDLKMSVFVPVGMYAWFDFTAASLEWHKKIAAELWDRYGHHESFYGWYVSEEIHGDLGANHERRRQIIRFFAEFQPFCRAMAPEKPVMLATNCHGIRPVIDDYRQFLPHIDILCPFGFHRMPPQDQSGEEAATLLQKLCDEAGTHLWLDMEAFLFTEDGALHPRPIEELISDFMRFPNFEKIICYQFPGIFNAPWARIKPGGPNTVRLFNDYKEYLTEHEKQLNAASTLSNSTVN